MNEPPSGLGNDPETLNPANPHFVGDVGTGPNILKPVTARDVGDVGDVGAFSLAKLDSDKFPLDSLGSILAPAARDMGLIVQVPYVIAAQSVLAVASLLTQSFHNISIDGRTYPLSLFFVTEAVSGDRKSGVDKIALSAIEEKETADTIQYASDLAVYEAAKADGDASAIKPISPQILCQEPTTEALQRDLYLGRPSQGLFNDEGGQFFGGHSMKSENKLKMMTTLSKFWDGSRQVRNRAQEQMLLINRRLAVHMMVQPSVAKLMFSDEQMLNQGITARFLICQPKTIQGYRPYNGLDLSASKNITTYNDRVRELLNKPLISYETTGLELSTLEVEPGGRAYKVWVDFYNDTEVGLRSDYRHVRPVAAKTAEQALRIAGVLSAFNGESGISEETMVAGVTIARYYLNTQIEAEARIAHKDESAKLAAMRHYLQPCAGLHVTSREIVMQQPGGTGIRSAGAVRELMSELEGEGFVNATKHKPSGDATQWLVIGSPLAP